MKRRRHETLVRRQGRNPPAAATITFTRYSTNSARPLKAAITTVRPAICMFESTRPSWKTTPLRVTTRRDRQEMDPKGAYVS
jgi:hypothetical protein